MLSEFNEIWYFGVIFDAEKESANESGGNAMVMPFHESIKI